ncbi:MAG: helix-turn-helix domain-containing protein [Actinomycetota bacterium]|jgi:excisionase family DNA binding protein|nr:helix-turn-helix domain-containing protein [Actinomycetota bacterium]
MVLRVVPDPPSFDELPEVLTIEEAAKVLRISRGAAYALARQWLDSGGREGLPVVRLGRSLRVPRAGLLRLLDVGGEGSATGA